MSNEKEQKEIQAQKAPGWLWTLLIILSLSLIAAGIIIKAAKQAPKAQEKPKAAYSKPAPKKSITELTYAEVVVPAGKIVNTHFYVRRGERIWFQQLCQDRPRTFYIYGKRARLPVKSERFSCPFSTSDYIYLKGGPITTIVAMWK